MILQAKQRLEATSGVEAQLLTKTLAEKFYVDLIKALEKVGYKHKLYGEFLPSGWPALAIENPRLSILYKALAKIGWVNQRMSTITRADGTWPINFGHTKAHGPVMYVTTDNGELTGTRGQP